MRGGCRRARRLDGANRRSTAGGRAEEIQRGRRKSSSKPRVSHIPQGLANAGAVISRKIPAMLRACGNWKRGESGGGKAGTAVPPPARMTVCTYRIVYHCKTHSRDQANRTPPVLSNHIAYQPFRPACPTAPSTLFFSNFYAWRKKTRFCLKNA